MSVRLQCGGAYRIIIRLVSTTINAKPRNRLSAAERRERILAAATEVFAEQGYTGASMGEIANRAGVVASVIYDHFESKADLHVQLLQLHGESLIQRSIEAVEVGEPETMLRSSIELYFRLVEEDPFVWRFMFRDPPAEPEIAATWARIHDAATAGIAALLRAGGPDVEFFAGADAETAAWMLAKASQSATNGLAQWWFEHREVPREVLVELSTRLLWDGFEKLLADASRP
jgi:AcrR family transcriptional regulator